MRKKRIAIGFAAVTTMSLTACAPGSGGGSGDGNTLTYVAWGGSGQAASEKNLVQPWAEKNGVTIRSEGPTDYAKLKAQVESGNPSWDVVSVEPFWAMENCGTLLEPIADKVDTANLPKEGVSDCTIPYDSFGYVLVYDADKFGDDPPTSWADYFNTRKYPGKRGMMNFANSGALEAALLGDGVSPSDLYPLDVDRALKKIDTIKDDIAFYDTGAQQVQQIESGDVAMSIAWSTRASEAMRNGAPFEPVWNGAIVQFDSLSVPKGSGNVDQAVSLIKHATSPEAQKAYAENWTVGVVNPEAKPQLDAIARKFTPSDPANAEQAIWRNEEWWAKNFDATVERWTTWAAG